MVQKAAEQRPEAERAEKGLSPQGREETSPARREIHRVAAEEISRPKAEGNKGEIMEKHFAVFIDGDNISWKAYDAVISEVKSCGDILEIRVYGDWTKPDMKAWEKELGKNPAVLFQAFRSGSNAIDHRIIMDATKMAAQNTQVNAFCIASSDSDYRYLAGDLRAHGKYVLGIGKSHTPSELRQSCTKFFKLDSSIDEAKMEQGSEFGIAGIISDGIIGYGFNNCTPDKDGWVLQARFCEVIKKWHSGFSWYDYGKDASEVLENYAKSTGKIEISREGQRRLRQKKEETVIGEGVGVLNRVHASSCFIENKNGDTLNDGSYSGFPIARSFEKNANWLAKLTY